MFVSLQFTCHTTRGNRLVKRCVQMHELLLTVIAPVLVGIAIELFADW